MPGAVPLAGLADSHEADSSDGVVEAATAAVGHVEGLGRRVGAARVALNDRLAGATASTGVAGFTVNVTSTVLGEPVAPAAVTVTGAV